LEAARSGFKAGNLRYNGKGVRRFAFLFPNAAHVQSMMNQSSAGEDFLTEAFTSRDEALAWLQG
jgi:hypothetical protein